VNCGTFSADTPNVRQGTDNYFVRLEAPPETPPAPDRRGRSRRQPAPRAIDDAGAPPARHRRRRGVTGRSVLLFILAAALLSWTAWALQQPGGISGTINGWIEDVRGTVVDASASRDLKHATEHYNEVFRETGKYPVLDEAQLGQADIGVGIEIVNCGTQAVVVRSVTQSRLLLQGENFGDVTGRVACPEDLNNPAPWK
jgi:hypothetical protein